MLERGSRRQELREAMTCFVFASRTVRLAEEIKKGNDSREEEEEEGEKSEEEERKERRDRGPVVVPWRAIYREPNFFPSFFIPASRAPGGPLRLFFAFCLRRESCRMRALHLPFYLSSFFCTDRPPHLFLLGPVPLPRFTCVYPAIPLSNLFRFSFRCRSSRRGGGAVFARHSHRWRKRSSERVGITASAKSYG